MKTKTMIRSLLAVVALVTAIAVVPKAAEAAGTGTATFGDTVVTSYTDGTTALKVQVGATVYAYLVLTSAQTTTLRKVYSSTPDIASGGATPAAVDGTPTLPGCAPSLGDLTD